jgi:hypothetical protein
VVLLEGIYYQSPDVCVDAVFRKSVHEICAEDVQNEDVAIALEIHPNNASADSIQKHDPLAIMEKLVGLGAKRVSMYLDITANHFCEEEIQGLLKAFKPYLDTGQLNLVLIQSGTKFLGFGLDLVPIGVVEVFNNGKEPWLDFNDMMACYDDKLFPQDDRCYLALLYKLCKEEERQYLELVRRNTILFRDRLTLDLQKHSFLQLSQIEDDKPFYVAFRVADEVLDEFGVISEDREKLIIDFTEDLEEALMILFRELESSCISRASFGFNITSFDNCERMIRFKPGVESKQKIANLAAIIGVFNEICFQKLAMMSDKTVLGRDKNERKKLFYEVIKQIGSL